MSFLRAEDDDLDFAGGGSSKLANLFGIDNHGADLGNQSLTYTAPKQPKKEQAKQPEKAQGGGALTCLHAIPVTAYKLVNGQYENQGKVGAAVLGNHENSVYNMILYRGKQQPIAMASISESYRFIVQPNNYANFYDNQKQNWSVLFDTSEACSSFAKHVALAMANSAGINQLKKLIIQDLVSGEGNELAMDDSAEMKYTGWFLSNYTFGKVFDTNKNTDKQFRVKLGKGKVIKGWEEGLVGAKKNSVRLLVIPPHMAYGAQGMGERIPPNSILIFEIALNKVKIGKDRSDSNSRSATPQLSDSDSMAEAKIDAKPNIAAKPRSPSVKSVENIRARGESITEQLSSSPKTNKAKIISRMAKMGQPMIPLDGAIPVQPSDDSAEEIEETETDSAAPVSQIAPQPSPKKESPHVKKTAEPSITESDRPSHFHAKPAQRHIERQDVPTNEIPHQQLSLYQSPNPYAQHPGMMVGSAMGYPNASFQQSTVLPPQYLPVQQVQPPPATPVNDSHTAMLLSETRTQNTEVRLNLSKLCDKVDLVMSSLNDIRSHTSASLMPSAGYSALEPTLLLHSITKMVQENTALKKELEEKRFKLESQSEKISELLHRNQRFIEQSNDMFERKNDSLQSTALESQARVFSLEKEKNALSYQLNEALSKLNTVQQQLSVKQVNETELMSKLGSNSSISLKNSQELSEMKSKVADAKKTVMDLQQSLRSEKQDNQGNVQKLSSLQDSVANLQNKNSSLEKSLASREEKIFEQSKEFEAQVAQLKASHLEEVKSLESKSKQASSSASKSNELQNIEETLNAQWQEKCDKLLSEAEIKHKQRMNDEQKDLLQKVRDLKQKLQESVANSGQNEEVQKLESEVKALSEWKAKYENLHSNVIKMKARYEETIEELRNSSSENSQDTIAEVKKVMNAVYKQLQGMVDTDESYTGSELLQTVLKVIRDTTIQYLQKNRHQSEGSTNPDENDSERGIDEVDEQNLSRNSSQLDVSGKKNSQEDTSSDQESPSQSPDIEETPQNTGVELQQEENTVSETASASCTPTVNLSQDTALVNPIDDGKEALDEEKSENENDPTIGSDDSYHTLPPNDQEGTPIENSEENLKHSNVKTKKESTASQDAASAKAKNANAKDPIGVKPESSSFLDLKPAPPPLWSDEEDDDDDAWLC